MSVLEFLFQSELSTLLTAVAGTGLLLAVSGFAMGAATRRERKTGKPGKK